MTNEKAIELLSKYFSWCPDCIDHKHTPNCSCDDCMCKATDIASNAIEKRIPKKPVGVDFDMVGCASCKMVVVKRRDKYCPNCGQKQDWEEEE